MAQTDDDDSSDVGRRQAPDIQGFSAKISELAAAAGGAPLWFRGSKKATYELLPTLFRHDEIRAVESLLGLENRLLSRFQQRALPFLSAGLPDTQWERLFLMQHYGVPTRLLDWSENAFVALWFALNDATERGGQTDDATVWVLNPTLWNRQVLSHQQYRGGVLSIEDPQLGGYEPGADVASMNSAPVALYGTHNSPRIVAQRGVFTISGKDRKPMESFVSEFKEPSGCIFRIEIPALSRASVFGQLRGLGFTESMIFPDLEGLARELKFSEGF